MNNENNKNNSLLMYIIIILLIIIIGVGGVLVFRSYKDINNNITENNKTEEKDNNELKNNLLYYLNFKNLAYDFWYSETNNFDNNFGFLYKNKKTIINELADDLKMFYVINNVECDDCEKLDVGPCGATKITKDELKNQYYNLLGNNDNVNFVDFDFNTASWIDIYDDYVLYGSCGGDTYGFGYFIKSLFVDFEINDDEIYLFEDVIFTYTTDGEKYNIYNDVNYNNLIVNDILFNNLDDSLEVFKKYSDKIAKYKYTFKYNDNGDGVEDYKDYYFYSVEKVK